MMMMRTFSTYTIGFDEKAHPKRRDSNNNKIITMKSKITKLFSIKTEEIDQR